jgi:hypothetical protein
MTKNPAVIALLALLVVVAGYILFKAIEFVLPIILIVCGIAAVAFILGYWARKQK